MVVNQTELEPGQYTLFSDGSCHGNPGMAGAGWVILKEGVLIAEGFRPLGYATNQVAEIRAAAEALNALPSGCSVEVLTDSQYVVKTMLGAFKKKANLEHWKYLDSAVARHAAVRFTHVRGHQGTEMNELADRLANQATRMN
jgi:ribonuclease HI